MLRPYQKEAIESIKKEYLNGVYRQLLVMATGTGKTVVFSSIPAELKPILPGQTLILLHREELADQAIDKLRSANPNLIIHKDMGVNKADPSIADIIVAGVGTLGRKNTKRVNVYNWENFDKFIVDEAHRSVAQSYQNVYETAGLNRNENKRLLLGVTATPFRGDGKPLVKLYQKIVYSYDLRQAIQDSWLVDVKGIKVTTKTSLDSVKTVAGEYDSNSLSDAVDTPERNLLAAQTWLENASDRISIGFGVNIQHCENLAKTFQNNGIEAEYIYGDDPKRESKIKAYRQGEIPILFNAQLLNEGFDLDKISCVLMTAPTKSGVVFSQRIGRGTRLMSGKSDLLVIDMVDISSKHSLTTLPTLFGMSPSLNLKGTSLLGAAKRLEEAQEKYSHLDFSYLDDIGNLDSYIESVDLFNVKYPPEVEDSSELIWHRSALGGFVINLPNKLGKLTIAQNMLDKWEVSGVIGDKKFRGEREQVSDAFQAADSLILKQAPESMKLLSRGGQSWHLKPASIKQINLLHKLLKGKPMPKDLDSGTAHRLISSMLSGK